MKKINLQLFAEGAEGVEAFTSAENEEGAGEPAESKNTENTAVQKNECDERASEAYLCEEKSSGASEERGAVQKNDKHGRLEALLYAARENTVEKQYKAWQSEAEALRKEYPDFDLSREMENPTFRSGLRLGMDMKALYCAIHFDTVSKEIAASAAEAAAEGIRQSLSRPREVGSRGPRAVRSVADVASLTDADMEKIVSRIARGDRISFS